MTRSHRFALRHLGLAPGLYINEIAQCGRDVRLDRDPKQIPTNPCQAVHFDMGAQSIWCSMDVRYRHDPRELEARVLRAVSAALDKSPELNTVFHPGRPAELYRPHNPIVATRRLWDGDALVCSLYLRRPHDHTVGAVQLQMKAATRRARALPYDAGRPLPEALQRLGPAPRAACAVTNCQLQYPTGTRGMLSLNKREGATSGVVVSPIFRRGLLRRRYVNLGIIVDHRVHMGKELGLLAKALKAHIEGEK